MRLAIGVCCFALSLLALFPAPNNLLWKIAILVTEWGHVLAFISALLFLPGWRRSRKNQMAAVFGLIAAILLLTPLLRAAGVTRHLPAQLQAAFGETQREAIVSAKPLAAFDLFRFHSPASQYTSLQRFLFE